MLKHTVSQHVALQLGGSKFNAEMRALEAKIWAKFEVDIKPPSQVQSLLYSYYLFLGDQSGIMKFFDDAQILLSHINTGDLAPVAVNAGQVLSAIKVNFINHHKPIGTFSDSNDTTTSDGKNYGSMCGAITEIMKVPDWLHRLTPKTEIYVGCIGFYVYAQN